MTLLLAVASRRAGRVTVVLTAEFEAENGTETAKLLVKKIRNEWKISGHAE
jgi:hypothetical protein